MFSTLITGPTTPIFTTAEAKHHARINTDDDDTLVDGLVATATAYFDAKDGVTGDALISQTWRLTAPTLEIMDGIKLPVGPVQSITSIQFYVNGSLQTLDASNYRLTNGYVYLTATGNWLDYDDREDAMRIDYVAGYGDAAADIAQTTRHAIGLMVAYLYDFRHAAQESGDNQSFAFQALLAASRSERGMF